MTGNTTTRVRIAIAAGAAVALIGLGAAMMYLYLRPTGRTDAPPAGEPAAGPATGTGAPAAPRGDVALTLAPEVIARAGIATETAHEGARATSLRFPGVVEPNAYRQVVVTAVAAGRMLSVAGELGQVVRRGDPLARMHVPELADAERAYVAMQADLQAARLQVARIERLVKIGAASQQELEQERATETKYATAVEDAKARLGLLGRTPDQVAALTGPARIDPDAAITAPVDGTITRRLVNVGQNVETGAELFTVVDLSSVWIVGDVYERDLALIRLGSPVTMTSAALPGVTMRGTVSYIDPQVAVESRTARVRIEVPNRDGRLRLGMYADLTVDDARGGRAVVVPKAAVQVIDNVAVVYVADERQPGRFVERSVRAGVERGGEVEILSGLQAGERVVTSGSFALRSERERRGFALPSAPPEPTRADAPPARHEILITPAGFSPASIEIAAGAPVDLVFVRQTEETCATEVVVPALGIRRELPLNRPVVVRIPPQRAGTLAFSCGMDMFRGAIVVK